MAARNIADHLDRGIADKPRDWQPLVYCWRGGQRSGSLAWFLDQIGFRTAKLQGGYKGFRAVVRQDLADWPARFDFRVLAGRTGSGKTRLLQALAAEGAQVLDLVALACHRGSILGGLPGQPQPTQKAFDNRLWQAMRTLDASRPVFVESESKKIGRLQVPDALIERLHQHGQVLRVDMADDARVQLLLEDYGFFAADPDHFCRLLDGLVALRGKDTVAGWQTLARSGAWAEVFGHLMQLHYDPLYNRSIDRHYAGYATAPVVAVAGSGAAEMQAAARSLLA
jgi:tRNA 2-selenouridine synthase